MKTFLFHAWIPLKGARGRENVVATIFLNFIILFMKFPFMVLYGIVMIPISIHRGHKELDFVEIEYENYAEEAEEESNEEPEEEEVPAEQEWDFSQRIRLGKDMDLLIDHVEMCPDETAIVRVVDDEGFTPLYKRKVRYDKRGGRYIVFNGEHFYLDDEKTQAIVVTKEVKKCRS